MFRDCAAILFVCFDMTARDALSLFSTIRSTVSDSSFRFKFRFIFRFESETGSIVAYKMWNCSVSFHGINVIRQGHPSSDYCAFDKTIL